MKKLEHCNLTSLNSAICFCENKTNTLDGAFFARLEEDPLVEPRWESDGVAADAGVSAGASEAVGVSAGVSSLEDAFFFLAFFSFSDYRKNDNNKIFNFCYKFYIIVLLIGF